MLEVSAPLFAQKGFAAVSVRELAEAADVNIAAISYYFHGKEGLYQAILEEQFAPIVALLYKVAAETQLSPLDKLNLYAEKVTATHHQCPYMARLLLSELTNPTVCFNMVVKPIFAKMRLFIYTTIQDGIRSGDFRSDLDAQFAALSLAGIMNFYFIAKPLAREFMTLTTESDSQYTAQALGIYLDGIRRKKDE